jgi:hypothetical protein
VLHDEQAAWHVPIVPGSAGHRARARLSPPKVASDIYYYPSIFEPEVSDEQSRRNLHLHRNLPG